MAWSRYRRLLGLLSVLCGHSALCAYDDRIPDPETLYDFPRGNCLSDLIELSALSQEGWFGNLELSQAVICNDATGITGSDTHDISPAVSSGEADGLPARIGDPLLSNGITLELWLKHPEGINLNEYTEIIGIRSPTDGEGSPAQDHGCDMCLGIENGKYALTMAEDRVYGPPVSGNDFEHFIITIDAQVGLQLNYFVGKFYVGSEIVKTGYWTGSNPSPGASMFENNEWKSTNHLHMLGSGDFSWPGSIYLAAIYTRVLTDTEIEQNYAAGLPKSSPVVFDAAITINEDGEVGDHYDDPSYYWEPVPTPELQTFKLPDAY